MEASFPRLSFYSVWWTRDMNCPISFPINFKIRVLEKRNSSHVPVLPKITHPSLVRLEFPQEPVHENNLLATSEKVLTVGGALLTQLHWSLMVTLITDSFVLIVFYFFFLLFRTSCIYGTCFDYVHPQSVPSNLSCNSLSLQSIYSFPNTLLHLVLLVWAQQ